MRTAERVRRLASMNGFQMIRDRNHEVWTDGLTRLVIGKTDSDRRAYLNDIARIKRACRKAGRDYTDGKYIHKKKEKTMETQPPLTNGHAPGMQEIRPTPTMLGHRNHKPLDDDALEICRRGHAERISQTEIAEKLSDLGYTSPSGGPLTRSTLSTFMVRNGIKYHNRSTNTSPAVPRQDPLDAIINEIAEVATSNLSLAVKKSVIRGYLEKLR